MMKATNADSDPDLPYIECIVGPFLFCIRMAHYSSGARGGWFSARTLSFH